MRWEINELFISNKLILKTLIDVIKSLAYY